MELTCATGSSPIAGSKIALRISPETPTAFFFRRASPFSSRL